MTRSALPDSRDYLLLELYYLYALLQEFLGDSFPAWSFGGVPPPHKSRSPESSASPGADHRSGTGPDASSASASFDPLELKRIQALRTSIHSRTDTTLPLVALRETLYISEVNHLRLLLALAPQIDPRFSDLYRAIFEDHAHHPLEPGFAARLLGMDWPERLTALAEFAPDNPLRVWRIVGVDSHRRMYLDERMVQFALGNHYVDEPLSMLTERSEWDIDSSLASRFLHPLIREIKETSDSRGGVWVHDRDGSVVALIGSLLRISGMNVLHATLEKIAGDEQPGTLLRLWFREALLRGALPVVSIGDVETARKRPELMVHISDLLRQWPGRFVVCAPTSMIPEGMENLGFVSCVIGPLHYAQRAEIWYGCCDEANTRSFKQPPGGLHSVDEDNVERIARTYGYNLATSLRIARHVSSGLRIDPGAFLSALLLDACRGEAGRHVAGLGRMIKARFDKGDIVLPDGTMNQLEELCGMARLQARVSEEWGLGDKLMPVPSVTALFAGPSGTGKTMAAEIIANILDRPLLRVDLAAVVSKYIGDTEKNLERVFRQAEDSCSVLFFDEADALFGKRSEVKEAHDRYANIEISYLLQRMEQYRGVAILASNLRQHLDDAFVRRLTMTILFPFPGEKQRVLIWKRLVPRELPIDPSIDWDAIARRYKISGGNIRNALIAAAFHAAMDGGVVTTESILHGIRREIQKMGKQMTVEQAP